MTLKTAAVLALAILAAADYALAAWVSTHPHPRRGPLFYDSLGALFVVFVWALMLTIVRF